MKTPGHVLIIHGSPPRIRQGLIRLLNPNKLLGILLDPTRRRHVRVVFPGQLLVRLLDLRHGSGLGYAEQLVEGELLVLRHHRIVNRRRLGLDRPEPAPEREYRQRVEFRVGYGSGGGEGGDVEAGIGSRDGRQSRASHLCGVLLVALGMLAAMVLLVLF